MLSPSGQRLRQTFRKLPKARPNSPAKTVPRMRIMPKLSIRLRNEGRIEICGIPPIPQKKAEWMGHRGFVESHPSGKNKDAARVGHPVWLG